MQVTNFAIFGGIGCLIAFAWRPTLGDGLGARWYPRLRLLSGFAMIGAAVFSQDPANGYPLGVTAPATPSLHAELHNVVSYVTLALTVTELVILALRFRREPSWRRWALPVALAAIAMMAFLAAFGVLIANHGPGGIFEKLASVTPTVVSTLIVIRLIVRRDARLGTQH